MGAERSPHCATPAVHPSSLVGHFSKARNESVIKSNKPENSNGLLVAYTSIRVIKTIVTKLAVTAIFAKRICE